MIRVFQAADLPQAHLLVGLLRHAGIEAQVLNEHARGGLGDIPFGETYPEVWIAQPRDLERAKQLIGEFELRREPGRIFCRACGEENPDNFELCWKCGAALQSG